MSNTDTSGPAFPRTQWPNETGMTLRDYFAAKAMVTLLQGVVLPTKEDRDEWFPKLAALAYEMADAMLKAKVA